MKKVAIATDSNSGITQAEAQTLGIRVLPMPFYINEELFFEDVTLTQEAFYRRLAEDADISTSQPSPGDVTDLWEQLLESHDQVVYIPMSSGLSASCETALMLSSDYRGRVFVVDNQRISITQRQSVLDALEMARAGMDGQAIHDVLVRERLESSIYITVDTLKYLKKGGRVTAAGAAIGTVLNIKPVLTIQGAKLDAFAKARGWKSAKKIMLDAMERDVTERFETLAARESKEIVLRGRSDVTLCCDALWLSEALGNLVKNALEHTGRGGRILIGWERTALLTNIVVEDNGKGIHPEDIHNIFKRFYRSRFSQDTQGIGLGLPLAKAIVEAHQGTISVTSRVGQGSRFVLSFFHLTER